VEALIEAGLGLDYQDLRVERTAEAWVAAGSSLRADVARALSGDVAGVELIGSSSVVGLLAKPIIDLAVGVAKHHDFPRVRTTLETNGWIYRGDAGEDGGHVFVLEARPWFRVAHLHVVEDGGEQWSDYLRLRGLLRQSPDARRKYEAVKLRLIDEFVDDRKAYTDGKSDIVRSLLREPG